MHCDSCPPRRTGLVDFPHPALLKTVTRHQPYGPATQPSLWRRAESVVGSAESSVVGPAALLWSKRLSFRFDTMHIFSATPSLHSHYGASSLLWAAPIPVTGQRLGYVFPSRLAVPTQPKLRHRTRMGLPGSSVDLSTRAVPLHPGEPGRCNARCWATSGRLQLFWQTGHSHLSIEAEFWVHWRYGSRRHRPGLRQPDYSDLRRFGYVLNGQLHGGDLSLHQINQAYPGASRMTRAHLFASSTESVGRFWHWEVA